MEKMKIVKEIEKFIVKHGLNTDMRIYFNGIAWDYDSSGNKTILKGLKASDFFDYANDKTISLSFEGGLYEVLNNYMDFTLKNKFDNMLEKFGVYYELGNAWNCSIYES